MTLLELLIVIAGVSAMVVGFFVFGAAASYAFATGHIVLGILAAFLTVFIAVGSIIGFFALITDSIR